MFPGGMNPKQMQAMLKRMGIRVEEIEAQRVVIEGTDSNIVITNPQVLKTKMPNQEMFQITGNISEEEKEVEVSIEADDIKMVVEKTGVSNAKAKQALEATKGDIAEAIMKLTG